MMIEGLKGKKVKICRASLTMKDDNGKTRGVVTGIRKWDDFAPKDHFEHHRAVTASGIWGNSRFRLLDNVIMVVGEKRLYYLDDLAWYKRNECLLAFDENFKKHYEQRKAIAIEAAKYMNVIECYLV